MEYSLLEKIIGLSLAFIVPIGATIYLIWLMTKDPKGKENETKTRL